LLWSSRVSYSNLACFFSPIVSQFSWFSILILFAGLLRVLILLKSRKHTTNSPWNSTSLSFSLEVSFSLFLIWCSFNFNWFVYFLFSI
jgi:hypothetical protein